VPSEWPGTFYKVAADVETLYGKTYQAVVVHLSSQGQRRQHLARELQASYAALEATRREMAHVRHRDGAEGRSSAAACAGTSAVQQPYLAALGVPTTCLTGVRDG
jgi:hypothetical protein